MLNLIAEIGFESRRRDLFSGPTLALGSTCGAGAHRDVFDVRHSAASRERRLSARYHGFGGIHFCRRRSRPLVRGGRTVAEGGDRACRVRNALWHRATSRAGALIRNSLAMGMTPICPICGIVAISCFGTLPNPSSWRCLRVGTHNGTPQPTAPIPWERAIWQNACYTRGPWTRGGLHPPRWRRAFSRCSPSSLRPRSSGSGISAKCAASFPARPCFKRENPARGCA